MIDSVRSLMTTGTSAGNGAADEKAGAWPGAATAVAFAEAVESGRLNLPLLRTAEDHALLAAATEAGCAVLQAGDLAVETSSRRHARAPDGFGQLLRTLAG